MEEILLDIAFLSDWKTIIPIKEGWSADKKYYITDNKGLQYLLRLSYSERYEEESHLYHALRQLNEKDIPVSKLLDSGLCNHGKNTYRLYSWIEGVEIIKIIESLSEKEHYAFGYAAGEILSKIHEIRSPENRLSWGKHYAQKIDNKIERYRDCGITFPHSERLIDFIESRRNLIDGRPQSFHHGDYHLGNMLVTPDNHLAVIDFNRLDFGDPWEEFNRIPWSASRSAWFASGQINGYFDNEVPTEFFELMALYIGVNQLGSIPWAIPYGERQLEILLNQTWEVMNWYDNFDRIVPKWYKGDVT